MKNELHQIPIYLCLPFATLLVLIATLPLFLPQFWEKNRNKTLVAAVVSLPVLFFLLLNRPDELLAVSHDYLSFILLLAALFVISGGIVITGDLKATPLANTLILLFGAVIANLIGTTGASMLLIRPLLQSISERRHIGHIPIFFIIIVSNIGGCLTPLGDPPLFLGYLRGVPFTWTLKLFPLWLTALGLLLLVFYLWDLRCYRKETSTDVLKDQSQILPLRISGKLNLVWLLLVVATIFFQVPKPFMELLLLLLIMLSLWLTPKALRTANSFTFYPIIEVAVLFAGIFITMVPLLDLLRVKGASLGITEPWQFFWLTGGLSSFLDNAPTYLTFSSLAESVSLSLNPLHLPLVAGIREDLLVAISCGAVFMGANTYIGNGPNFMVRAIATERGIKMPQFFGYFFYSGLILIPVFLALTYLFFV